MSVKIFLPQQLFTTKQDCEIFGEIQINENAVSYFVIDVDDAAGSNRLRHLGYITAACSSNSINNKDVSLSFTYDSQTPTLSLNQLSIRPPNVTFANVFLYNCRKIQQLFWPVDTKITTAYIDINDLEQFSDIRMLYNLLVQNSALNRRRENLISSKLHSAFDAIGNIFSLIECRPIMFILQKLSLQKTSLLEHYVEWKRFKSTGIRTANISMDRLFGLFVMIVLLFYVDQPGDYLIQASHFVIEKLRLLLGSLKGSPIGLKLNVHLNNFFLDCFSYHIDLWALFLNLIEPYVPLVFVPIALLGFMGFSFQLAMLSDLIWCIGLHAYCFYIYTAVLYKVETRGLQVLWKVVLGKRRNPLKNRDESHNYMNRQLFLATLFFTSLLFLFPTILVYYIVFTTLRLCIYVVRLILKVICRRILEFPLQLLLKWIIGSFYETDSLQLQHRNAYFPPQTAKQIEISVFDITVGLSSLSRVFSCESGILKELTSNETSVKSIFYLVIKGEL